MCNCQWETGECQAPLNCKALGSVGHLHEIVADNARLRDVVLYARKFLNSQTEENGKWLEAALASYQQKTDKP